MSENEKLPLCPFCGTENVSMSFSATLMSADPAARFVECEECAACGPSCDIIDGDDDDAKRRALAAWKTRAALSAIQNRDAGLREALSKAFVTSEVHSHPDPIEKRMILIFNFSSLDDLHAAHRAALQMGGEKS